jgi:hypothetical protein
MRGFGGYGTAAVCRRQCAPRLAGTETGGMDFLLASEERAEQGKRRAEERT